MALLPPARRYEGEVYSLARAPQQRHPGGQGTARNWQIAFMLMMVGAASACALFLAAPSPSGPRQGEPARPAAASARLELRAAVEPFAQKIASEAPARKPAVTPDRAPAEPAMPLQRLADLAGAQSTAASGDDGPVLTGTISEAKGVPHAVLREPPLMDVGTVKAATKIQRRLAELRHFSGPATGVWGPISRAALRSFKEANQLASDEVWNVATQETLFSASARRADAFVGRWGPDAMACSRGPRKGGFLPTMIESNGARAGDVSCAFKDKRQVDETWDIVAQCSKGRERWTARIRLAVKADRLTWTSERGSQTYVRCSDHMQVAGSGQ